MNVNIFSLGTLIGLVFQSGLAVAQCENWVGKPNQSDAENAHSIYRQAIKMKDMAIAFENWQTAYKLAPAADGKRDYHYIDGVDFYKQMWTESTDPGKRTEYAATMHRLYKEAVTCYQNGTLTTTQSTEESKNARLGFIYGRMAYDMFYYVNTPYVETIEALDNCIKYAGDQAEYIILDIYPKIIVYQFKNAYMTKEKAVELYKRLNQIAEYNISNNERYAQGYQQAQANMEYTFSEVALELFDCDYFKEKLVPEFEENKDNPDVMKRVIATLKSAGCPETDSTYMALDKFWKEYATKFNEQLQAEYDANNPASAAKRLFDEGKFTESINKYRTAIAEETDNEKKATYLFAIASIQFRKLNQYSEARKTAYDAAKLKPNWGRPYMLIGDMYGKTARSCGDSWNQRLAILAAIDKYSQARSIDGDVAGEASQRINAYYGSLPPKDEGFMRGLKEGDSATVGCWIGESVRLRFR